jgi:hypothetical protein
VNGLLIVAIVDFAAPYSGSTDLTAFANKQVSGVKTITVSLPWGEVHFGETLNVYTIPLHVNIAQVAP